MMRTIFNIAISLAASLLLILALPAVTHAFDPLSDACSQASGSTACSGNSGSTNPISGQDGIINKVAHLIIIFTGVVAVIMVMVGGLLMILANGDAQRFATGRNTVIYAFVGLTIAALAQGIISFALPRLTK